MNDHAPPPKKTHWSLGVLKGMTIKYYDDLVCVLVKNLADSLHAVCFNPLLV